MCNSKLMAVLEGQQLYSTVSAVEAKGVYEHCDAHHSLPPLAVSHTHVRVLGLLSRGSQDHTNPEGVECQNCMQYIELMAVLGGWQPYSTG